MRTNFNNKNRIVLAIMQLFSGTFIFSQVSSLGKDQIGLEV